MIVDELEVDPRHLLPLRHLHRVARPLALVDVQMAVRDHLQVRAVVHELHDDLLAALLRALRELNQRVADLCRGLGRLPEVRREEDLVLGADDAVVVVLDNVGYTGKKVRDMIGEVEGTLPRANPCLYAP